MVAFAQNCISRQSRTGLTQSLVGEGGLGAQELALILLIWSNLLNSWYKKQEKKSNKSSPCGSGPWSLSSSLGARSPMGGDVELLALVQVS